MWVFKRLARWWHDEYGGEHVAHADFAMEAGDTFASAFHDLFERASGEHWRRPVPEGQEVRVHVKFSFSAWDLEEEGSEKDRCLTT